MTDEERSRLRALQDRWLVAQEVRSHIKNWGWDESIATPGSPTFRQVRDTVLPDWSGWFEDFLRGDA